MSAAPMAVELSEATVNGRPGRRLMVILRAPGCAWAAKGGCTNCGFPKSMGSGRPVTADELVEQLDEAAALAEGGERTPLQVDLLVSGSFFNPDEIPVDAQERLLRRAAAIPGAARLLVETRPEYVTRPLLERALAAACGLPLEVGIGLESADETIREVRIRKGFTWAQFEAAARLLGECDAELLVYVLLKPIDTSEAEAVADAVATCERVHALGRNLRLPTRVALQPCFVAPGTPLEEAFLAGHYRPPWLWSVVEVVRQVAALGPLTIGLSDEGLGSPAQPANCPACSAEVTAALAAVNAGAPVSSLDRLDCACRLEWRRLLAQPS